MNSGPTERMNLRITVKTRHLIAMELGMVITMAMNARRKAQISPERCPPVSVREEKELIYRGKKRDPNLRNVLIDELFVVQKRRSIYFEGP